VSAIQSMLELESEINVIGMSNYRNYLDILEKRVEDARQLMEENREAFENVAEDVYQRQLNIERLEKYHSVKDRNLFVEMEKEAMKQADELWLSKMVLEKSHD
jgi:flagellar biosynthesis chaperone FliJ